MSVLFIGKRFYTNRDAFKERFGRIYQLPWYWSCAGVHTTLWLIDYHSRQKVESRDGSLLILSTPAISLSAIKQIWRTCKALNSKDKPRIIVASGDCYIGLLGYLLAKCLKARFVFDVYDKYDEFSGYFSPPGIKLFDYLLSKADYRLFASRALCHAMGLDPDRDVIVPNGIDTEHFRPLDMAESRLMLGLPPGKKLVGYMGSMEPDRGIDDLIAAINLLREKDADIHLVLGGKMGTPMLLDKPWIHYLGNVPFSKVPRALASCDVLAIPYRESTFMDMGASCKIMEYIAAERPIAATSTPNLLENFRDQAEQLASVLAIPGDPQSLAASISRQLSLNILTSMPKNLTWQGIAHDTAARLPMGLGLSSSR